MSLANGVESRKGFVTSSTTGSARSRSASAWDGGSPDPSDLRRSFLEASRAVDVGRWAKGRHVTEVFDELGLERLLASAPADDLAEFVEHAIGPLVDHDRTNDSDLVETLEVWLETRNMAEAARRTHVHYNTLKNRLERIETILGPIMIGRCSLARMRGRDLRGPPLRRAVVNRARRGVTTSLNRLQRRPAASRAQTRLPTRRAPSRRCTRATI